MNAVTRRSALVTGASRGIGFAIAQRLAKENFDLTVLARSPETLESAAEGLRKLGGRVETIAADLSDEAKLAGVLERHIEAYQTLDVLVLSAGVGSGGPITEYSMRRFDKQFAINFRSPFLLVQQALPALREAAKNSPQGAKIIALASITGMAAEPDLAVYGATKAALISLCESIIVSEAETGVSATSISPGYVDTDMADYVSDRIEKSSMISADDIAELAYAITQLSKWAAVPNIAVTRPGRQLWRA